MVLSRSLRSNTFDFELENANLFPPHALRIVSIVLFCLVCTGVVAGSTPKSVIVVHVNVCSRNVSLSINSWSQFRK